MNRLTMLKLLLTALLFYPTVLPAQEINVSPETIFASLREKYRQGNLDSIKPTVKINEGFGRVDTSRWFYTYTDTIYNKDKTWAVGRKIIDPFMEFNDCRIGIWTARYANGQLFWKGAYSLAATISCQSGGVSVAGYCYRTGYWQYWHANGNKMAYGDIEQRFYNWQTGCGEDKIYTGAPAAGWHFYSEDGMEIDREKMLLTQHNFIYPE